MRFGHLTIIRDLGPNKYRQTEYECRCDCGASSNLRTSHFTPTRLHCSRSCSLLRGKRMANLVGQQFGAWTVREDAGGDNGVKWRCVCVCGSEQEIETYVLQGGHSTSCGCVAKSKRRRYFSPEAKLDRKRELSRLSARKHASRIKAAKIKYEAKLSKATPSWLTAEDWAKMDAVYAEARRLSKETGVRHEVDHIVPLNGKCVSGLHVPGNLQILTQAQNVRKSNRYAEHSGD